MGTKNICRKKIKRFIWRYCRSSKTNGWEIYFSHVPDYPYKIWRTSENGGSIYNTKSSTKREVISAEERFYVTWCYLTGGDSYLSLASQYRIGVSTISNNVAETTLEIWNSRCRYGLMHVPENNEDWIKIWKKKEFSELSRCNWWKAHHVPKSSKQW